MDVAHDPPAMTSPSEGDASAGFATPVPIVVEDTNEPTPTEEPADPNAPTDENPLVYCAEAVAVGEHPLVDDFEDGDLNTLVVDNRAGQWFMYDDGTPGGTVSLQMGDSDNGTGALHVTSSGWAEWGSGIAATLRSTVTGEEICYYDASRYDGIRFRAKGTGVPRVAVVQPSTTPVEEGGTCSPAASCYDIHGADVPLTDDWVEYRFEFTELEQAGWGVAVGPADPTQIFAIHFQMGASRESDVWLDDLGFFSHDESVSDAGADVADADASGSQNAGLDGGTAAEAGAPSDAGSSAVLDAASVDVRTADGGR